MLKVPTRPLCMAVAAVTIVALAACQAATPRATQSVLPSPASTTSSSSGSPVGSQAAALPGGRLVFDRFDPNNSDQWLGTFIAHPDGSNPVQLKLPIAAEGGLAAVWSPDGKRLLVNVWTPTTGPARVAIVNADGSGLQLIEPTGIEGDFGCSDWSPDGSTLLCSGGAPARSGIYSVRTDGTTLRQLTDSPYHDVTGSAGECGGGDGRGVFSPDGTRFAFIRQKCGTGADPGQSETGAIIVENVDGTGLRTIVPLGGVRTHPGSRLAWSPDGREIAFGTQDLLLSLVRPDGTGLGQVNLDIPAIAIGGGVGPAWSPDGTRIVFSAIARGVAAGLYVVAPDGSGPLSLDGTAGAAFVDWGPATAP